MNAPFQIELVPPKRRAVEVEFLAERYHRAFDEEAAALDQLVARFGGVELALQLEGLRRLLEVHERLQESQLFPAYERGASMDARLFDVWVSDSAAVSEATKALRDACARVENVRLVDRIHHFAAQIEQHLVDEVEVLVSWAGAELA